MKIGEIGFWGWTWNKPRLIITIDGKEEVWIFNKNNASFLERGNSIYKTSLTFQDKQINYNINLLQSLVPDSNFECFRGIDGNVDFESNNGFVAILGIYLNELMIFDGMNN